MTKVTVQNRLKSKVFWVSILSAVALVLKAFGLYEIDDQMISITVDTIFSILVIFGVANNPTNPKGF